MIILKQTGLLQTISLVPNGGLGYIEIEGDKNDTLISKVVNTTNQGYYVSIDVVLDLIEDRFYTLKGYTDNTKQELVVYDRIFCTNQSKYTINKGSYKENPTNNEYVIIK
jgi:hypothetical protein